MNCLSEYAAQLAAEHAARQVRLWGKGTPKEPKPAIVEPPPVRRRIVKPKKSDAELQDKRIAEAGAQMSETPAIKIRDIQLIVCAHYGILLVDLLSPRRDRAVVWARQIAMWLCKTLTLNSLRQIGASFGGRNHTTVLHSVRKIENLRGRIIFKDETNALVDMIKSFKLFKGEN